MMRMLRYIVLTIMLLLAAGCGAGRHGAAAAGAMPLPDKGQVWQLVSMRGRDVKSGDMVTLVFNPDGGFLHGMAHCNSYYAECMIRSDGGRYSLKLSNMTEGSIRCPDAVMNAQFRYTALLMKADAMEVTAYTLTLYSKGKEILKFELQ